jgi:hypothetical protein
LGERISAEEFLEACVYLREEPLDPALLQALAEVLAALANGALSKQDKTLWTALDFLAPRWAAADAQPVPATQSTPTAGDLRALFDRMR